MSRSTFTLMKGTTQNLSVQEYQSDILERILARLGILINSSKINNLATALGIRWLRDVVLEYSPDPKRQITRLIENSLISI